MKFLINGENFILTHHARQRMSLRGISMETIRKAISYGRKIFIRGSITYAIGRREAQEVKTKGIQLMNLNGIQIVCSTNGRILTVYRNKNFRGLRPQKRKRHSSRYNNNNLNPNTI